MKFTRRPTVKKINLKLIGQVVLYILALTVLIVACRNSNQSTMAFCMPIPFEGEYSIAGEEWKPLTENTDISSFDGDLLLRGNFDMGIEEGNNLNFYLNHIGMSMSVNGEEVYVTTDMLIDTGADLCGTNWVCWTSTGIGEEDIVEIRLHNPHRYGNKTAYTDFLKYVYGGEISFFKNWIGSYTRPFWIAGFVVLVVAFALLGMAIGFRSFHISYGKELWHMGMLTLLAGGYILLDTPDISLKSHLIVFNTYGRQLCLMLAGLELGICIAKSLSGKAHRIAVSAVSVLGAALGILLIPVLTGKTVMYDMLPFWTGIQAVFSAILFGCCILEWKKKQKKDHMMLLSFLLVLAAVLLELANTCTYWWMSGILVKIVFVAVLIFQMIRAVMAVPAGYRASVKAEKLSEELKNSRIVLYMSQIRTHFIFNVLNAISGMCKYDPDKADETVVRFARFLRSNMDIMEEDRLVPFERALEHVEDYVALEEVRFGGRIEFVTDIEVSSFKLPSLILQPLVENAIRHGLLSKPDGGMIVLRTWTDRKNIMISIEDDGVGFEPDLPERENSLALKNIRFRLENMVNGRLDVQSCPGHGTKVTITIPYQEEKGTK